MTGSVSASYITTKCSLSLRANVDPSCPAASGNWSLRRLNGSSSCAAHEGDTRVSLRRRSACRAGPGHCGPRSTRGALDRDLVHLRRARVLPHRAELLGDFEISAGVGRVDLIDLLENLVGFRVLQLQRSSPPPAGPGLQIPRLRLQHLLAPVLRQALGRRWRSRLRMSSRSASIESRIHLADRIAHLVAAVEVKLLHRHPAHQLEGPEVIGVGLREPSFEFLHGLLPLIVRNEVFGRRHMRGPVAAVDQVVGFDKYIDNRLVEVWMVLVCPRSASPSDRTRANQRHIFGILKRPSLVILPSLQKVLRLLDEPCVGLLRAFDIADLLGGFFRADNDLRSKLDLPSDAPSTGRWHRQFFPISPAIPRRRT